MKSSLATVSHHLGKWSWVLPALALGLFVGRLLSEWLKPGIWGAIVLTLVSILVGLLLLQTNSAGQVLACFATYVLRFLSRA